MVQPMQFFCAFVELYCYYYGITEENVADNECLEALLLAEERVNMAGSVYTL